MNDRPNLLVLILSFVATMILSVSAIDALVLLFFGEWKFILYSIIIDSIVVFVFSLFMVASLYMISPIERIYIKTRRTIIYVFALPLIFVKNFIWWYFSFYVFKIAPGIIVHSNPFKWYFLIILTSTVIGPFMFFAYKEHSKEGYTFVSFIIFSTIVCSAYIISGGRDLRVMSFVPGTIAIFQSLYEAASFFLDTSKFRRGPG